MIFWEDELKMFYLTLVDAWGRLITDSSRLTLSREDPPRPPRGCEYLSGKSPSQRTARVQGVGITLYFVTLL